MTRTQYYTSTSIDGFIADQDNSLDWLFEAEPKRAGGGRFEAMAPVVLGAGAPLLSLVAADRDGEFVALTYSLGVRPGK
jgi:hypothetical protein